MATIKQMFKELVDITPKFTTNKDNPHFKDIDKAFTVYFEEVIFPQLKSVAKNWNSCKQIAFTAEKLKAFGFQSNAINKHIFKDFLRIKFMDSGFAVQVCFEDEYNKVDGAAIPYSNRTKDTTDEIDLLFSWDQCDRITEYHPGC
jgi:hypothetical protein